MAADGGPPEQCSWPVQRPRSPLGDTPALAALPRGGRQGPGSLGPGGLSLNTTRPGGSLSPGPSSHLPWAGPVWGATLASSSPAWRAGAEPGPQDGSLSVAVTEGEVPGARPAPHTGAGRAPYSRSSTAPLQPHLARAHATEGLRRASVEFVPFNPAPILLMRGGFGPRRTDWVPADATHLLGTSELGSKQRFFLHVSGCGSRRTASELAKRTSSISGGLRHDGRRGCREEQGAGLHPSSPGRAGNLFLHGGAVGGGPGRARGAHPGSGEPRPLTWGWTGARTGATPPERPPLRPPVPRQHARGGGRAPTLPPVPKERRKPTQATPPLPVRPPPAPEVQEAEAVGAVLLEDMSAVAERVAELLGPGGRHAPRPAGAASSALPGGSLPALPLESLPRAARGGASGGGLPMAQLTENTRWAVLRALEMACARVAHGHPAIATALKPEKLTEREGLSGAGPAGG